MTKRSSPSAGAGRNANRRPARSRPPLVRSTLLRVVSLPMRPPIAKVATQNASVRHWRIYGAWRESNTASERFCADRATFLGVACPPHPPRAEPSPTRERWLDRILRCIALGRARVGSAQLRPAARRAHTGSARYQKAAYQKAAENFIRWITSKAVDQKWFGSQQAMPLAPRRSAKGPPLGQGSGAGAPGARRARANFQATPGRPIARPQGSEQIRHHRRVVQGGAGVPAEEAVQWAHAEGPMFTPNPESHSRPGLMARAAPCAPGRFNGLARQAKAAARVTGLSAARAGQPRWQPRRAPASPASRDAQSPREKAHRRWR